MIIYNVVVAGKSLNLSYLIDNYLCFVAFNRAPSAFNYWLSKNRAILQDENPELDDGDLIKEATQKWRTLSTDDKKVQATINFTLVIHYLVLPLVIVIMLDKCIAFKLYFVGG